MRQSAIGAFPQPGLVRIVPGIPADGFGGRHGAYRRAGSWIAPLGQFPVAIGKAQRPSAPMPTHRPEGRLRLSGQEGGQLSTSPLTSPLPSAPNLY